MNVYYIICSQQLKMEINCDILTWTFKTSKKCPEKIQ